MKRNETGAGYERRAGAAFTLTEVIIAVVLMLLALGLLISSFVSSKHSVALAQTHLAALQIARSEAEQLQTNAYTNIAATSQILTNAFITYTMSNSVADISNRYKNITITVKWIAALSSNRHAVTNYMTICNTN